ncbi:MAG: adenylate/guanylate cyclase domain-containing protein [Gaiellaceae bacterium]
MLICSNCGEENPAKFRMCGFCGTPLVAAAPAQETRKLVSILFCDLKGSTSLGETLDPESMREVIARYFDVMSAAITRHGGTIEKYIGDAVMAVFGLPKVHEDDALRAVRAAEAMQLELKALNVELEQTYGVTLANRIGVNTGGVVAGDATTNQRLVTGDAVNVAARLEQAAGDTETLLGELTYKLVAHAVDAEPVEPLTLKGKAEPVPAYKLVRTHAQAAPAVHSRHALLGRSAELETLLGELDAATQTGMPRSVLLLGEAGVGKTRLLDELADRAVPESYVLRGRCLSYGEGITFWPMVEAIRTGAGIVDSDDAATALEKIEALAGHAEAGVVDRVGSLMGLSETTFPLPEIFWGFRRLLEVLSSRRPVLLLIEDLHWAESTLHDFLESMATCDAGVLILCAARTEVLERRPELAEQQTVRLDRLGADETRNLIESWLDGPVDTVGLERIVEASSGNPLFAQQLVFMLRDEGLLVRDGEIWKLASLPSDWMPPTIHALLSARIDRLEREDRSVLDPAAVVGHIFPLAAIAELADGLDPERVAARADELTRTQILQTEPERDGIDFRAFHHIFIRDSVYESLLKRQRASLHERFVEWADRVNGDRKVEFEEILGYHLEQAHRFLSELAPADDHVRLLGIDAARRLASAGRRAFVRGDMPAAANLLRRALTVLPADAVERFELAPDCGEALMQIGDFEAAEALLAQAETDAVERREAALAGGARIVRQLIKLLSGAEGDWSDDARATAEEVIATASDNGDEATLARAYRLLAWVDGKACQYGAAATSLGLAIEHARAAGDVRQERRALTAYALTSAQGPTPVAEAIERCAEVAERVAGDRQAEAAVLCLVANLEAMRGDFELSRTLSAQSRRLFEELGLRVEAASMVLESSQVELLAGNPAEAERELRRGFVVLEELRERYLLSTLSGLLARALWAQGRPDEAEDMTALAEELSDPDDIDAQVHWRSVQAKILAQRGQADEAEALIRSAVELLEPTDAVLLKMEAYVDLAEVLTLLARDGAGAAFSRARALAAEKGGELLVARVLELAGATTSSVPAQPS